MTIAEQLRPADVLLYSPTGFFGFVISLKSWHKLSHVEVHIGDGWSVAARDRVGTGMYTLRTAQLAMVCRPKVPVDLGRAERWRRAQGHQPYGWLDLLQFGGLEVDAPGIVCSPFATSYLRAGGLDPFNGEPATKIAPFQFSTSPVFDLFDVKGQELRPRQAFEVL